MYVTRNRYNGANAARKRLEQLNESVQKFKNLRAKHLKLKKKAQLKRKQSSDSFSDSCRKFKRIKTVY
jgi:hypothetical protein